MMALTYKTILEAKITHSDLNADWHVAVTAARFLRLSPFSVFLLQGFVFYHPKQRESKQVFCCEISVYL